MDRSPGFGSASRDYSLYSNSLSLRLHLIGLASPRNATRTPIMQKVRGYTGIATMVLPLLVSEWFQVLFHSPLGVLFTFPSRYSFTIGRSVIFSLAEWSPRIPTGFHVSCGTQVPSRLSFDSPKGLSPALAGLFMPVRISLLNVISKALQPRGSYDTRFGLVPFRSPLLRESRLISFPPGTEMFHFPGFALSCLYIQQEVIGRSQWGYPIRVSRNHGLLATPPSFSQLSTPFFASDRLGIHHTLFVACLISKALRDSMSSAGSRRSLIAL